MKSKIIDYIKKRVVCNLRNCFLFLSVVFLILSVIILFYFITPQELVGYFGIENSYIVISVLALIAGLSSFFATPYYISLAAFASGGINIYLLAIFGGLFISVGHIVYFYLGYSGEKFLSLRVQKKIKSFSDKYIKKEKYIPIFSFIYFAFTPFPNEIILTSLGAMNYSFKKIFFILLLGNIVLMYIIAELSVLGFNIIS